MNIHIEKGDIMRTNIVIDDKLMDLAFKTTGLKTKKAVVEEGLKALIKIQQQKTLKSFRGKLHWEGNIEKMRTNT
jgi:Arc/MetJ family transcription regulator